MADSGEERAQALADIRVVDPQKLRQEKLVSSTPSSPAALRKSASGRQRCLCSPTTHTGSFRCRYHRQSSGLRRSSSSIGSNLASLSSKLSAVSLADLGNLQD